LKVRPQQASTVLSFTLLFTVTKILKDVILSGAKDLTPVREEILRRLPAC